MAFDTDLLLKDSKTEKVLVETTDSRSDGQKQLNRFSSKIIKMDENNQYGQAMTKALPYGCIKKQERVPDLTELNDILRSITLDDTVGHLFTIDIEFHDINGKTLLFNEIYPPIFEKNKKANPYKRFTVQIMSRAQKKDGKDEIASFSFNSKTHATLKDKVFVSLYAEDIRFLVTRVGWWVTKIYEHYTFRHSKFKKDFVVMNQKACQTAKSKVEKVFYKLLNKSNFGNDCRNNIDQCSLELIYDGIGEISYLKKFRNIMQDWRYMEF